jgi:hypothetical protein
MEEMNETHTDFAGRTRHFVTRLDETPGGLRAEAVETGKVDGYRFKVVAPSGATGQALWALRQKMSSILNVRHIERENGHRTWSMTHDVLRGRITSSKDSEEPTLIVDGQPLSWEDVGRMLSSYEGFEFEFFIRT